MGHCAWSYIFNLTPDNTHRSRTLNKFGTFLCGIKKELNNMNSFHEPLMSKRIMQRASYMLFNNTKPMKCMLLLIFFNR